MLAFALSHLRGIVIALAIAAVLAIVVGLKHSYDEGRKEIGRKEVRALVERDTHRECGEQAKGPKDCFIAGQKSVEAEFSEKIAQANRTIVDTSAALEAANRSIDGLKAESARKAQLAAKMLADLEQRSKAAADEIARLQLAQPTGNTPCESACTLLRSSF